MKSFENENSKFIKEITTALAYYKLIYIEMITKDKSADAFRMLGGEAYFHKVIEEEKEENISLESTNMYMMQKFNGLIKTVRKGRVSLSTIITNDLANLDWLGEIISTIDPKEKLKDTICKSCSYELYEQLISTKLLESPEIHSKREIEKECNSILKLSKKK